ncbi:MAG: RDD family protein [Verrucomicrobiota bacterium JB023]|nr:RDD family protein [Verrucomicrobiota bacterium JB023]
MTPKTDSGSAPMEVWLIENGEKTGPYPDYEVRSRIRRGELKPETKAWFTGMDAWQPLGEIELYQDDFATEQEEAEVVETAEAAPVPPPIPQAGHLWRRFAARWFDWTVFQTIVIVALLLAGVNLVPLFQSGSVILVTILPAILVEAILLAQWGTTPGKWLTGLKLRNRHDDKLTAGAAILRTIRVWLMGMGLGTFLLLIPLHLLSAWLLVKKNLVLWDTPAGNQLLLDKPAPGKWVGFGLGFVCAVFLNGVLLFPTMFELTKERMDPKERELIESLMNYGEQAPAEAVDGPADAPEDDS